VTSGGACAGADLQQPAYEVLYEWVGGMRQYLASTCHVRDRPQMTDKALRFGIVGQFPGNSCMTARSLQSRTSGGDVGAYHQLLFPGGTSCGWNCMTGQPCWPKLAGDV